MPSAVELKKGDFEFLTPLRRAGRLGSSTLWECECVCGTRKLFRTDHLRSGRVVSCGCKRVELMKSQITTHGRSHTPVYWIWSAMVQRCTNSAHKNWDDYGGRGITVCVQWLGRGGFDQFLKDMGEPPDGMTLERRKNHLGYSPGNCCWASRKDQANNRRKRKPSQR